MTPLIATPSLSVKMDKNIKIMMKVSLILEIVPLIKLAGQTFDGPQAPLRSGL